MASTYRGRAPSDSGEIVKGWTVVFLMPGGNEHPALTDARGVDGLAFFRRRREARAFLHDLRGHLRFNHKLRVRRALARLAWERR
jgi:alpha-beta hydrolase superfamily lysophospholipase